MVLAFQETRKSEFKSVKRLQDGTCQFQFSDEKSGSGNTKMPEKSAWQFHHSITVRHIRLTPASVTAARWSVDPLV
ncbi:YfdQ family protein [Citrobacter amalonaticus]|uniref:YfdQ family protein n=1 Tax=Citrobacter amalonaticus TaxID=35703 RepID=UPI0020A26413|nr:YfdQ family protein [Citrobacter amalonaticus]